MNGPEGLSAQTFQPYLSNIQINKQNTERLKGFSGKKLRIGSAFFKQFRHLLAGLEKARN